MTIPSMMLGMINLNSGQSLYWSGSTCNEALRLLVTVPNRDSNPLISFARQTSIGNLSP